METDLVDSSPPTTRTLDLPHDQCSLEVKKYALKYDILILGRTYEVVLSIGSSKLAPQKNFKNLSFLTGISVVTKNQI